MSGDEGAAERRPAKIKNVRKELMRVRLRGIDDLDKKKQPQKPVQVPTLEGLARAYCQQKAPKLHGRIAQIRRLLEDGIAAYGRAGNERGSELIESLFFDGVKYMNAEHATSLAKKAQQKIDAEDSAQDFETRRDLAFDGLAAFLVDWLDEEDTPQISQPSLRGESEVTPAEDHVEQQPVIPDEVIQVEDATPKARRKKKGALLAGTSGLLAAAIVSWQLVTQGDDAEHKNGKDSVVQSLETSAAEAQKESKPSKNAASSAELPTGSDLEVSYGFPGFPSDFFDTYTAAFQEEDVSALKELLARPKIAASPADPALTKLIEARGYFLSGMKFNIVLTSANGKTVNVVRIRPVNIKRDKIPVGAAFLLPSQGGGDVRQMSFNMDSESPIARHPASADGPEGTPFFQSSRIVIKGGDEKGEEVASDFSTVKAAYTFQVAIEYQVDGTRYRQLVPGLDGKPGTFRIAANLCPLAGLKPRLSEDELAALGKLRYKNLRGVDEENLEDGYTLIAKDPDTHVVGVNGC